MYLPVQFITNSIYLIWGKTKPNLYYLKDDWLARWKVLEIVF